MSRRTPRPFVRRSPASPAAWSPASWCWPPDRCTPPAPGQRHDARRLHRLRLRPVPGPDPEDDEHLAASTHRSSRSGIYISGDSRACRSQPNLTPAWVSTQLAKRLAAAADHARPAGLLPAALPALRRRQDHQPQARQHGHYRRARARARAEAATAVERTPRRSASSPAARSGTTSRASTSATPTAASPRSRSSAPGPPSCTSSATSPASTPAPAPGIEALDHARVTRPGRSRCPTRSGSPAGTASPNTSTSYIREDGWRPGGRVKQYQGGHDETWGGVRINIDRNFLDLGRGSRRAPRRRHCGGDRSTSRRTHARPRRRPTSDLATRPRSRRCSACSRSRASTTASSTATTTAPTRRAAANAWQDQHGFEVANRWTGPDWVVAARRRRRRPVAQVRLGRRRVRRLQRALNAAVPGSRLAVDGVFEPQHRRTRCGPGRPAASAVDPASWRGRRRLGLGGAPVAAALASGSSRSGSAPDGRADEQRHAGEDGHRDRPRSAAPAGWRSSQATGRSSGRGRRRAPPGATWCASAPRRSAYRSKRTVANGGSERRQPEQRCGPADQRWSTATSTVVRQ